MRLSETDTHGKKIVCPPLRGVLDSGASDFTISKELEKFLHVQLKKMLLLLVWSKNQIFVIREAQENSVIFINHVYL